MSFDTISRCAYFRQKHLKSGHQEIYYVAIQKFMELVGEHVHTVTWIESQQRPNAQQGERWPDIYIA